MKALRTGFPDARARLARALACCAGAVLLSASTLNANDGAVISLSVVPTSGKAQVVIGVDGKIKVRDFVLQNPDRIVVDIENATLGVPRGRYDGQARGGVREVRYGQFTPTVVRVVLVVDGPRAYEVVRDKGAVLVTIDGGGTFAAWRSGLSAPADVAAAPAPARETPLVRPAIDPAVNAAVVPASLVSNPVSEVLGLSASYQQQGAQPISITFADSPITDVIAQFAAFSRRTIIPARAVSGGQTPINITAEIKSQPWDVAFKVILNANGFDAEELPNGIIIVNTLEALKSRPTLEALTTRTIRFNYTAASAVAEALRGRLTRDCGSAPAGVGGAAGAAPPAAGPQSLNCPVRGAVTADTLTNSISITDAPSAMDDLTNYARTLDIRQPQVNIKAKIILVDRTQLEGLGLKYDIGSRNQHFNDVVSRTDSTGAAETGNVILLGGNTLSAIANASQNVPGSALSLVYSAALGAFDFTTFLEALQEVNLLDVQAEPSVTTLNYRTAVLSAGTQVPIRTTEQGAGGNASGALPQVTVNFRQTGIVLNVTPFITNNRQIKMRVAAENSDVQFISGEGAVFPTQKIENELLVADGETAVMGGLTQTSVRVTKSGIPLLVELPLIGRLFGVTNRQETKRDLLILITPHIVDEGDMSMTPRQP